MVLPRIAIFFNIIISVFSRILVFQTYWVNRKGGLRCRSGLRKFLRTFWHFFVMKTMNTLWNSPSECTVTTMTPNWPQLLFTSRFEGANCALFTTTSQLYSQRVFHTDSAWSVSLICESNPRVRLTSWLCSFTTKSAAGVPVIFMISLSWSRSGSSCGQVSSVAWICTFQIWAFYWAYKAVETGK